MKVGLFFGSFNPIHTGHLIIANHISSFYTDQIWFIVSPKNPFKKISNLLDASKRLELTKIAIEENPSFIASDIEFNLPIPSYTINTLREISAQNSDNQYIMIIGSDNFLNLSSWNSAQEIINNYHILVYERPGFPLISPVHPNIQIINSMLLDISSSRIRDLINQKKSIRYLVPEKARLEIEKYYR
jgi:nicotinate-nucleotide adenylyltransferase